MQSIWDDFEFPSLYPHATIALGCIGESLVGLIHWGGQYMAGSYASGDRFRVNYAVDGGAPRSQQWDETSGNEATIIPLTSVRAFVSHIKTGNKLVVRVWDYSDDAYTAEFDLTGTEWALNQLPCYQN